MTACINKSAIAGLHDFPALAAAFAVEMKNWRAHMVRVKQDEAAGVTGIEKHVAHPRPSAHPAVEAAVNENAEMDYEIVDDGPSPDQVLAHKKAELSQRVVLAEHAAIGAVVPHGKRRLLSHQENAISSAHAPRPLGLIKSVATAIGLLDAGPTMSAEDAAFIKEQARQRQKIEAIELKAAQAYHDIEDLTLETLDAWQIPDFKI